jgi:hypothetical protein
VFTQGHPLLEVFDFVAFVAPERNISDSMKTGSNMSAKLLSLKSKSLVDTTASKIRALGRIPKALSISSREL